MAEEMKPAALPGKECGAAKPPAQPQSLSEGRAESSAEEHVVPEDSALAGAPHEKSVKEVTEVAPEVKIPSSAKEGVCLSGFACVLQMRCRGFPQANAFPTLAHPAGSSHDHQTTISGFVSRECGLRRCCESLVVPGCSWLSFAMIQYALPRADNAV